MKTYNYIIDYFDKDVKIVDLATGSGCIAVTLKKLLKNSLVDAVDISKEALDVARGNALNLDIKFYLGNMLEPLNQKYDVIISNPPYLTKEDDIMDIVVKNEPHLALFAKDNGLYYYKEILKKASSYLNKRSLIAFEIGENQALDITLLIKKYLPNATYKVEKDMQNKDRFIFIFNR